MRTRGDRYQLVEVIGSGGMGTVWKARDHHLGRLVALKSPHPMAPGDPRRGRLLREAHLAASVSHPNLVEVFDVAQDDEGPFLIMELVEAPSLVEVGPGLSPAAAATTVAQVASALAAVHQAGIVHRDVKAPNVLMGPAGAKLVDFGVARSLDGEPGAEPTQAGVVLGTAGYTAPEVMRGEPASAKSDVYALGMMAAKVLPTLADLPPDPGSATSVAGLLDTCRADDPSARPSAATLADALGPWLPTDPTPRAPALWSTSPPPSPGFETRAMGVLAPEATSVLAPDGGPAQAHPAPQPGPAPRSGPGPTGPDRRGLAAVLFGGALAVAAFLAAATGLTGPGADSDLAGPGSTLPSTAGATTSSSTPTSVPPTSALTTTAPEPEPPVEGAPPPLVLNDPDLTEDLVIGELAALISGSGDGRPPDGESDDDDDDEGERVDKAVEKIAEKITEAHEAVLDGDGLKAGKKLAEAVRHASQDLDGEARTRALAAIAAWAVQLGLSTA